MTKSAEDREEKYKPELDLSRQTELGDRPENQNPLFRAGQSNRVWGELYKVIDSSDVVVQVVDARDPQTNPIILRILAGSVNNPIKVRKIISGRQLNPCQHK
uniref:Uncharacterized protein n=1 Tax=Caenorhabditis japonica TaxID=281687 RepID=A0A8R1EH61_CAEJA